jgi:hypothetical protein
MLEAMSHHHGPCETTIKRILLDDLMNQFGNHPDFQNQDNETSVKAFKNVIDLMFKEFGGIDVVGSMTNWWVHIRPTLLDMCIDCLKMRNNKNIPPETIHTSRL